MPGVRLRPARMYMDARRNGDLPPESSPRALPAEPLPAPAPNEHDPTLAFVSQRNCIIPKSSMSPAVQATRWSGQVDAGEVALRYMDRAARSIRPRRGRSLPLARRPDF